MLGKNILWLCKKSLFLFSVAVTGSFVYKISFDDGFPLELHDIGDHKFGNDNIFFIETSGVARAKSGTLNSRQACSVESAALKNPNSSVFMVFVDVVEIEASEIIKSLRKYKNIHFLRLRLDKFTQNTPAEDFIKSRKIKQGYEVENASDLLRVLILWKSDKYGGAYLDLDAISIIPLYRVGYESFVCKETSTCLAPGISKLSGESGHAFAGLILDEFIRGFRGDIWGKNGPGAFNRAYKKMCNISDDAKNFPWECNGISLLKRDRCLPIGANEAVKILFQPSWIYSRLKYAFFVHVWNHLNHNEKLLTNSTAGYIRIAEKYCPNVLKASSEYF